MRRVRRTKGYESYPRPEGPYYPPKEVARELDMDIYGLYTWIEKGIVNTLKIRFRGRIYHWIHENELDRLKKERINSLRADTAENVAKRLGIPTTTLLDMVRRREIKAIEFRGKYYIPPRELEKLKSRRGAHAQATTV